MKTTAFALAVLAGTWLPRVVAAAQHAEVARFAIVVGNNKPEHSEGETLRYADDDAVATQRLLLQAGVDSVLLVTLDEDTRRLYPRLQAQGAPRAKDLEQEFAALVARMRRLSERGATTEFFFFYSGHGDVDAGEGYVVLEDERLTRTKLYALLSSSPAAYNHVFVDACKSYFLAFDKGPGGRRESYGRSFGQRVPSSLDNTGFVLSTSSDRDSHEWERYQAGILSHELRSALRGAADADGDGRVTYAELGAFLATANESIANASFRPDFLVRPPSRNLRQEVLSWSPDESAVRLEGGALGHVYVETSTGERVLDAHPDERQLVTIHLPDERPLFVRRNDGAAEHVILTRDAVTIASLERIPEDSNKGAIHIAFGKLFASPFGSRNVTDYVLESPTPGPPLASREPLRPRQVVGLTAGAVAFGAAMGGVATGLVSLERYLGGSGASQAELLSRNRAVHDLDIASAVLFGVSVAAGCTWAWTRLWPDTSVSFQTAAQNGRPGLAFAVGRRF